VQDEWEEQRLKGCPSQQISIESCKRIFRELLKAYAKSTLIVDGLDECDLKTRHELINVLDDVKRGSESLVKIFIASRDDSDLMQQYEYGRNLQIHSKYNTRDIQEYVLSRMTENKLFKVSEATKYEILETIGRKSRGM
jgi:ankyrin repeat domain-containing protein 50